jgi:hypothetical protein
MSVFLFVLCLVSVFVSGFVFAIDLVCIGVIEIRTRRYREKQ